MELVDNIFFLHLPTDDTKPVFISFSFKNLTKVQKIVATLDEALWPNSCWICTTGIKGAQIIDEEIAIAMGQAKVVVGMISPDFINSVECTQEVLSDFDISNLFTYCCSD